MINVKELRLGNWVKHENGMDYYIETNHYIDMLADYRNTDYLTDSDYSGLSPIPLTEEWLVKFGLFKKGDCFIINHNFKIDFMGCLYCRSDFVGVKCHYVHQLQNLYFALTNKELEISE